MLFDAGDNLLYLASDLYLGAEELFRFGYLLAGDNLPHLKLHPGEILKGDFLLRLDIDQILRLPGTLFFYV